MLGVLLKSVPVFFPSLPPRLQDRVLLNREFLPWALRAGARAPDLMCIYCELVVRCGVAHDWCGSGGAFAVGC